MVREGKAEEVRRLYLSCLYRRNGFHRYSDVRGEFMAEIADVEPTGHLLLRFEGGREVRYELKEVRFIMD
jgi:BirA family biotin operon repressor/biotin-[acetyl-CoA-carboxylase] ligase